MKQPSINRKIIGHFWQASLLQKRKLLLVCIFIPINALFGNTFLPLSVGKLLASLSHPGPQTNHYLHLLILSAIVMVMANYLAFQAFFSYQALVMKHLEEEALDTLLKRSVGFHNNNIAGKLIKDAGDFPSAFQQLSGALFTTITPLLVALLSGIVVVLVNSLLLGGLVIIMTTAVIASSLWQTTRATPRREQRHDARRAMIAHQADSVSNSVTVKTFARENTELQEGRHLSKTLADFRIRDWTKFAVDGSLRIAMLLSFEVAFILLVIHLVRINPALLGIGIFTFSYVINLSNRLFDIGNILRTIEDALLDATDMIQLINTPVEIVDASNAAPLKVGKGAIEFAGVDFQYQDGSQEGQVFENLNLSIKPGQKIGLVGPSGGGKSTLSRLMLRFEDIQGGTISIDDQSIADVTQVSLRQAIAYVPQEPLLFHRTVRDNIAYGKPDASLAEVKAAAEKAYALDFIEALPAGFDTIVGERGVKLSGGQRQRVAIARAILKDAPIILLDEATSALDSESEVAIQTALTELMRGRTTIVIAHRLSTIQKLDRIIVLDSGTIIEDGSHKKLLAQKGLYARLWAHQSGGFIED